MSAMPNADFINKSGRHTMKTAFLLTAVQNGAKRISVGLVLAVAATFLHQDATAASPYTVPLLTAEDFSVLAYTKITDAGGASTISADVGLYPTTGAAIGLLPVQVGGTIYAVDAGPFVTAPALLNQAKIDLSGAFDYSFAQIPTTPSYGPTDKVLDGKILIPGVYNFDHAATANLTKTLTLDAQSDPNAVWIFQATSDLITGSGSKVLFKDGVGSPCNVYWVVGSSATLGSGTEFVGTIMALASIGLDTGATLDGRALAENAAVTLDHNTITTEACTASVPDTGSTLLLLGSGLAALLALRRRFCSPA
jgi:hypothetical protein